MQAIKPIFCLMGPTASGKTQLAIDLVQQFPFEIISVDSAMVYRGMDIGTAKPTEAILQRAPHRLLDIRNPNEPYSAAQFRHDALREIDSIFQHKKIPLLVGGTMMYFHALQQGLAELPSADPALRKKINLEGEQIGWPNLHARLQEVDPVAAQRIHPQDSQRIQRALEVFELTGKSLSYWLQKNTVLPTCFTFYNLALAPLDRAILHQRIANRFDDMLAQGFVEEVKNLFSRGDLNITLPSMRSVGYRQIWEYLQGEYNFDHMRERAIIATRQLAKRQLTWLRGWSNLQWFDGESSDLFQDIVKHFQLASLTSKKIK